jgi:hypothetical protein
VGGGAGTRRVGQSKGTSAAHHAEMRKGRRAKGAPTQKEAPRSPSRDPRAPPPLFCRFDTGGPRCNSSHVSTYRGSTGCSGRPAGPARCGRHRRGTTAERRHSAAHGVAPWLLDGGCALCEKNCWGADVWCYCLRPRFARSPADVMMVIGAPTEEGKTRSSKRKSRSLLCATWIAGGRRPGAATSRAGEKEVIH